MDVYEKNLKESDFVDERICTIFIILVEKLSQSFFYLDFDNEDEIFTVSRNVRKSSASEILYKKTKSKIL